MPRPAKPARLVLRTERGAKWWVIKDFREGKPVVKRTGCGEGDSDGAHAALERYLIETRQLVRRQRRLDEIEIADVLNIYLTDRVPLQERPIPAAQRVLRLLDYWGGMKLDEVTGAACRQFAATKGAGGARRELQDLQAAINYHHREGYHREVVRVTLPKAGLARERWLTRDEVAKLLRICLHHREKQDGHPTGKRPLRHLARFILFALYTGSRPGDTLQASFRLGGRGGYVDTGVSLYHRRPVGKRETKKRQPTTPIPDRLLAHIRRWQRIDSGVGREGPLVQHARRRAEIPSIKTAWRTLIRLANLGDFPPYVLRHTAITWMMQRGVPSWEVAGYVGTSQAMIEKVYGHHSPDHLKAAKEKIGAK